jgi:8-oxo-dGTP diphosphatase
VFDESLNEVLLIHKKRPASQAGKVNGLGGKLEAGEDAAACIEREVREEAGLSIAASAWTRAGTMRAPDWSVELFAAVYRGDRADATTMEDQEVEWCRVDALPHNAMSNLSWLIPMMRDRLRDRSDDTYAAFEGLIEYR